ncbi:MAG: hypothetical protein ABH822_00235 [Patescibacteria group bacterium]
MTKKISFKTKLLVLFVISLATNLLFLYFYYYRFHSTGLVFTVDSFAYLVKAREILASNLAPMRTHAIGWPLFVAPFLYFFRNHSIFEQMVYAQFFNSFLGALAVFPTHLLARQFLSKNWSLLAAFFTASSFWFVYSSSEFFAEPLFMIFLLLVLYFLVRHRRHSELCEESIHHRRHFDPVEKSHQPSNIPSIGIPRLASLARNDGGARFVILASMCAAFAYWLKPQGILLLIIVILSIWLARLSHSEQSEESNRHSEAEPKNLTKQHSNILQNVRMLFSKNKTDSSLTLRMTVKQLVTGHWSLVILTIMIFIIVSSPFLVQRYHHFGSPFFYGENSNYWADSYDQLWTPTPQPVIPDAIGDPESITFLSYLQSHSPLEITDRFLFHGLGALVFTLLVLSLPLTIFFLWGVARCCLAPGIAQSSKKTWPLLTTITVFLLALSPIYAIYFTPRYLFPFIPIVMIFSVIGLRDVALSLRASNSERGNLFRHFDRRSPEATEAEKSHQLDNIHNTEIPRLRSDHGRSSARNDWRGKLLVLISCFLFLVFLIAGFIYPQYYFLAKRSDHALEFGRWVAQNIRGKIAIALNQDFIMMNLPNPRVASAGLFDFYATRTMSDFGTKSDIVLVELKYPGRFEDIASLTAYLKENNFDYLALDRDHTSRMNVQPKIYTNNDLSPETYTKIYSDYDPNSTWAIDFYKLDHPL